MQLKFIYLTLFLILIAGCVDNKKEFVCPDGTIVSDPSICPKEKAESTTSSLACGKPYVLIGSDCCLDRNGNGVCDADEAATTTEAIVLITTTTRLEETTTIPPATTTSTLGNIACYKSSDCGVNGKKVVKYYTCQPKLDGGIYRRYIEYSCRNPGTAGSVCAGSEKSELLMVCNDGDSCIEGTASCKAAKGGWLHVGKMRCNLPTCPGFLTTDKTKKTCNVTCSGFLTLNNTKDKVTYYGQSRYDFKINYITSFPIGVNLSVQRAGKEPTDIFLSSEREELDDLVIELSAILMDYNPVVRIYVSKKNASATTTTMLSVKYAPVPGDNVPEGAEELRDITKDRYAASYLGYSFKINEVIRLEHDPGSVKVDVMKPDGMVVTIEISSEFPEKVDDLLIGTYTDYRTLEPVIWVYNPQ